jgi:hypothetical protein
MAMALFLLMVSTMMSLKIHLPRFENLLGFMVLVQSTNVKSLFHAFVSGLIVSM